MARFVKFNQTQISAQQAKSITAETLITGGRTSQWWRRQSADFTTSFADTMRQTMRNGESITQAITRVSGGVIDGITVPGIIDISKRKAGALASSAINAVQNDARLATFQENQDVIKGTQQVSTLDNRTSDICVAYSGKAWKIGTLEPIDLGEGILPFNGGPPRHFNCRSTLVPVLKSFEEMGIPLDEIPVGTRASMDGQVPGDQTFTKFLNKKPKAFQDKLLGPKRAQLFRDDKITLTQLVDMRGNPLTITQLEAKVGIKAIPPPVVPPTPPQPTKAQILDQELDKLTAAEKGSIRDNAPKTLSSDQSLKFKDPEAVLDPKLFSVEVESLSNVKIINAVSDLKNNFVFAPRVAFADGKFSIIDGRHRIAILKRLKAKSFKVTMTKESFEEAVKAGVLKKPLPPKPKPKPKPAPKKKVADELDKLGIELTESDDFFKLPNDVISALTELNNQAAKGKSFIFNSFRVVKTDERFFLVKVKHSNGFFEQIIFKRAANPGISAAEFLGRGFDDTGIRNLLAKQAGLRAPIVAGDGIKNVVLQDTFLSSLPDEVKKHVDSVLKLPGTDLRVKIIKTDKRFFQIERINADSSIEFFVVRWDGPGKIPSVLGRRTSAAESLKLLRKQTDLDAPIAVPDPKRPFIGKSDAEEAMLLDSYGPNVAPHIKKIINQSDPLRAYVSTTDDVKKLGLGRNRTTGAWYQPWDKTIVNLEGNSGAVPTAIRSINRHEYGHHIDSVLSKKYFDLKGISAPVAADGPAFNISAALDKSLRKTKNKIVQGARSKFKISEIKDKHFELAGKHLVAAGDTVEELKAYYAPRLKKFGIDWNTYTKMVKRDFVSDTAEQFAEVLKGTLKDVVASFEVGNPIEVLLIWSSNRFLRKGGTMPAMISDYFSATTKNSIRGPWGHDNAYYNRGRFWKNKEAFANSLAMLGDAEFSGLWKSMLKAWNSDDFLLAVDDALKELAAAL